MKTRFITTIAFVLTVLVAACIPTSRETSTQKPDSPTEAVPTAIPATAAMDPTDAATPTPEVFIPAPIEGVLADTTRQDLAARLGVDFTMIGVLEISRQDWPDVCLGLTPEGNQPCTPKTHLFREVAFH